MKIHTLVRSLRRYAIRVSLTTSVCPEFGDCIGELFLSDVYSVHFVLNVHSLLDIIEGRLAALDPSFGTEKRASRPLASSSAYALMFNTRTLAIAIRS